MQTASPAISSLVADARARVPSRGARRRAAAVLLAAVITRSAMAAMPVTFERQDPRLFGYQLGDVIPEQVEIRLAPGYALDPQSLPRPGKRAGWFLVRSADAVTRPAPGGGTQVSLHLEMQLTNSPTAARSLTIPEVALRFKGPQTVTGNVPGLTIDAVPMGTGDVRTGLPDVRPPRAAPLVRTQALEHRLRLLAVAGGVLAAWLLTSLALRWLRPRERKPFAQAQRELRALLRTAGSVEGARLAVQRVHRAFDQAAGQRLFGAGVPAFCRRMGVDSTLEQRTVAFFHTSQALFFASDAEALPGSLAAELAELCRAWSRFEARHP